MIVESIDSFALFLTLLWTIYQQYQINKMCRDCPFRKGEIKAAADAAAKEN